jgi:hypothetical protein
MFYAATSNREQAFVSELWCEKKYVKIEESGVCYIDMRNIQLILISLNRQRKKDYQSLDKFDPSTSTVTTLFAFLLRIQKNVTIPLISHQYKRVSRSPTYFQRCALLNTPFSGPLLHYYHISPTSSTRHPGACASTCKSRCGNDNSCTDHQTHNPTPESPVHRTACLPRYSGVRKCR